MGNFFLRKTSHTSTVDDDDDAQQGFIITALELPQPEEEKQGQPTSTAVTIRMSLHPQAPKPLAGLVIKINNCSDIVLSCSSYIENNKNSLWTN